MIDVEPRDAAWRQAVGNGEEIETAEAKPGQPKWKHPDPDAAVGILGEKVRRHHPGRTYSCAAQDFICGKGLNSVVLALPPSQTLKAADPEVATRIFEDSKNYVGRQTLLPGVCRLRRVSGKVGEMGDGRISEQPFTRYPPLPRMIFERNLGLTPGVGKTRRQPRFHREEALAIELMNRLFGQSRYHVNITVAICAQARDSEAL